MRLQTLKPIPSLIFLMGGVCLLLFMNCQTTDAPVTQGSFSGPDTTQPPYLYTNPNPPSGPPDPTPKSDPKNPNAPPTSNIVWLHTDVSSWAETSQIADVKIQENGQICIEHSKSGQWNAQSNVDSTITEPVEGNAWVIVPIDDKYYAATYDYLRGGKPCHTLDAENITNLYHSDKSLGKRTNKEPLDRWVPLAGDTIAFMVSGLARNEKRNVQERSNIIRVTLPSADGVDPTIVHPPCSEDPTGPLCSIESCHVPNRGSIVRDVARSFSTAFQEGHQLNLDRVSGGPKSQSLDDPRWGFMDRVAQRLYRTDNNWGYTCVRGDCDDISTDAIAYQCDEQSTTPTSSHIVSHDVTAIDIINADGSDQWSVHREIEDPKDAPKWQYPRTDGVPDYYPDSIVDSDVSDFSWDKVTWLNSHNVSGWAETSQINSVAVRQSGQICIDHTKAGQWCREFPLGGSATTDTGLEGNPYIIVKINGTYYAATYEWLRPGQICKLGHAGPLSATYSGEHSLGKHTKRSPLEEWVPAGGEVIGFMVSGLARNRVTPNNRERSNIVWYRLPSLDGSIQGGEVGRFSGGGGAATDAVCSDHTAGQCSPSPPNLSNIVQKVAEKTGDLYKTNVDQFTGHVADCLKEIDSNFGRYKNSATSGSISDDAVGYRYERASPCKVDIVVGASGPNPKIGWTPELYPSNTWVAASGQCIIEDIENMVPCTQEQLADGFQTVDGLCVPLCLRMNFYTTDTPPEKLTDNGNFDSENEKEVYDLYGDILKHIEIGADDLCADDKKAEYNILKIDKPVAGANKCCRISKKTECPPHYELKTINGERNCYPNCGQAAEFAGYGGYGADRQSETSDDPHVYFPNSTTACQSQSTAFGGEWKEMPSFYDPYRFKTLTASEAQAIFTSQSSRCCVRGQPTNTPAQPHNNQGTYTTATSTTTNSATTPTTRSANSMCPQGCSTCEACQNGQCVRIPNCRGGGGGNPECEDGTPSPCGNQGMQVQ